MPPGRRETRRLYFEDAYLVEFEADVVERRRVEGRPAVVLDRTCFYPESGGQPWDQGTIEGVDVLEVVEDGDTIVHVLAARRRGPTASAAGSTGPSASTICSSTRASTSCPRRS